MFQMKFEILWLLKQDTGGLRSRQLMRLGHELSSTQLLRIADWSWFKNTIGTSATHIIVTLCNILMLIWHCLALVKYCLYSLL